MSLCMDSKHGKGKHGYNRSWQTVKNSIYEHINSIICYYTGYYGVRYDNI